MTASIRSRIYLQPHLYYSVRESTLYVSNLCVCLLRARSICSCYRLVPTPTKLVEGSVDSVGLETRFVYSHSRYTPYRGLLLPASKAVQRIYMACVFFWSPRARNTRINRHAKMKNAYRDGNNSLSVVHVTLSDKTRVDPAVLRSKLLTLGPNLQSTCWSMTTNMDSTVVDGNPESAARSTSDSRARLDIPKAD